MSHPARLSLKLLFIVLVTGLAVTVALAQPPTVATDVYTVNAHGYLSVDAASGLLANDTGFSATTHRIESYDSVSQFGGVVFVAPDGAFTYDPPVAFKGRDTFTYIVRNAFGANTTMVTIDVAGETVWFVDDSAAAGGDGTINAPFNSLTNVNGSNGVGDVDANGHTIFVYEGNYAVEFDLEAGQKLIGHSEGLDLIGTANDVTASAAPILTNTGTFPIVELFGAGGTVRGFVINNTNSYAIQGASVSDIALANIDINATVNATGGMLLNGVAGTNTLSDVDITGALPDDRAAFVLLSNAGTINFVGSSVSSFTGGYVLNVNANSGTITLDSTSDLSSTNTRGLTIQTQTAAGVVTLAGVDLDGGKNGEPLVRLQSNNASSTVNFEEGVLADTTTADSTAFLSDGGRLKIAGTTSALSATDGPALYLESVTLTQNATFASLSSASSNARGISIADPVGNNDIIVTGTTTISTPTTEAVRVNSTVASNFLLQMATLTSSGGTVGIDVTNTAVSVTNSASTLTTSAGPAVRCTTGTTNLAFNILSAAGGTNGVSFDGCSGTVTASAGTLNSTGGATNHVVNIVNSSGTNSVNFTFGGNVQKTTAGRAVNIDGLANPGAVTFDSAVVASNASGGVSITNSSRPVSFTTLNLAAPSARFTTTPITLTGNDGVVSLGNVSIYTNEATALNISYANPSPGQVNTGASSRLDVTGDAVALIVSHASGQPLGLQFIDINNPGAGTHGINISNSTGALVVTGLATFGAKSTAGVQISNTNNFTVSIDELDITGAFDGVRLSNNGGTSSFSIMGDGNFSTSHTDGLGGTFTNVTDNAFDLTNVVNFRATDVTITGTGSHGVTGRGLTGTTIFSNVDFSNIGDGDNEHVFNFQEGAVSGAQVSGTLDINNSVINNFSDNGIYLENFTSALNFRFTDNTLQNNITKQGCTTPPVPGPAVPSNCNGNGILLRADGTASIVSLIDGNTINQIDGLGITANPEGSSNARLDLTITDNTMTANAYGGASHTNNGEVAISLRNAQGNSDLYFNVDNNTFDNYSGEFAQGIIEVEGGDTTTTHGRINNNDFLDAHFGSPIGLNADGSHTSGLGTPSNFDFVISVTNNVGPSSMYGAGVYILGRGGISGSNPNAQVTITNNNFSASPTGSFQRTLMVDFGDYNRGCFNIFGNTLAAGVGGGNGIDFYYDGNSVMRLEGMTGSGDGNAIARLNSTNTVTGGVFVGSLNNITAATCTLPTAPNVVP